MIGQIHLQAAGSRRGFPVHPALRIRRDVVAHAAAQEDVLIQKPPRADFPHDFLKRQLQSLRRKLTRVDIQMRVLFQIAVPRLPAQKIMCHKTCPVDDIISAPAADHRQFPRNFFMPAHTEHVDRIRLIGDGLIPGVSEAKTRVECKPHLQHRNRDCLPIRDDLRQTAGSALDGRLRIKGEHCAELSVPAAPEQHPLRHQKHQNHGRNDPDDHAFPPASASSVGTGTSVRICLTTSRVSCTAA